MNGNMNLGKRISALEKGGGGGSSSSGHIYSTEEKVVGKWTNGKRLYEKTYIGNTTSSENWVELATTNELNINEICHEKATWYSTDGYFYEGNKVDGGYYFQYRCGRENIQYSTSGMNMSSITVTIQYTKTE